MTDCFGAASAVARLEWQFLGKLGLTRVPHLCPPGCNQGASVAATCTSLTPWSRLARSTLCPSQREGQLDDDADYQTAYQRVRTVAVNGGRG
jgi:hypothetical protein